MSALLLHDGMLSNGRRVDVAISDATITAVAPSGQAVVREADTMDLGGRLILPALGEPHAHLDKAFTADAFPNPSGDLMGAIDAIRTGWETMTADDIFARASKAARRLVAAGTTAIRTHADVTKDAVSMSMAALVEVKRSLAGVCHMEVAALGFPVTGPEGQEGRRAQERAIAAGADLVGGAPHLEDDPEAAIAFAIALAAGNDLAVDLHLDEILDASVQHLAELARQTEQAGMGGRVTASHCVSHGLLSPREQRAVGRLLADAGVSVVTLPRTNLFLQARGREQAAPRGLAGVRALLDTGVLVAGGADNVQDPFYVVGRSDPLETASLLVTAAHLTVAESFQLVTDGVRRVMGLEPARVETGSPADMIVVGAASVREAIADQPEERIVIHQGRVVARTTVKTWMAEP